VPFSPLAIATTGLSAGASVDVVFSNASGYSVRTRAVAVSADGTVLTGVPMYVNPVTKAWGTGQVGVVVTQTLASGAQGPQSSPATLTIQDLPSLAGLPTGQLTHAFLAASALIVQQRLSQLQFLETALGGQASTAPERASSRELLSLIIEARNTLDEIAQDPAAVIDVGTASDGSPLTLTTDSLAVMDGVIAAWLSELPIGSAPGAARAARVASLSAASIDAVLQQLSTWVGLATDVQTLQSDQSTTVDNSLAVLDGVSNSASLLGVGTESAGLFLGWAGVLNATYRYLGDWEKVVNDVAACVGSGPCNTTSADTDALLKNGAGQLLAAYAQAAIANLNFIYEGAPTGAASMAVSMYNYVSADGAADSNRAIGANIASAKNGGALITGEVQSTATQSGLDMIRLSTSLCAANPLSMSSISDVNGDYRMTIPSSPYCTVNPSLTIVAFDPVSTTSYGSGTVYVGTIGSLQTVSSPVIAYTGPASGVPPTPDPTPDPTPSDACCACTFDVYCTVYGPGGCWRCQDETMVGGVCPAPYGYLTSEGACVCDAGLYQVCQ
jgi:hypothetical protein